MITPGRFDVVTLSADHLVLLEAAGRIVDALDNIRNTLESIDHQLGRIDDTLDGIRINV